MAAWVTLNGAGNFIRGSISHDGTYFAICQANNPSKLYISYNANAAIVNGVSTSTFSIVDTINVASNDWYTCTCMSTDGYILFVTTKVIQ